MRILELDNDETNRLLENKRLTVDYGESTSLEIYDNQITFNENGEIFTLHSAHLEFNRQNREDYWMANDLKNLICDHLNLNPNEVVLYTNSPEETVFKVRLIPEKELVLIVCNQQRAISNRQELLDTEDIEINEQIGPYRQLGNSYQYFRWSDEV